MSGKEFDKRKKLFASLNILALVLVFGLLAWNYSAEGFLYVVAQGEAGAVMNYFAEYSFWEKSLIAIGLVLVEVIVGIIPAIAMYPIIGLVVGDVWALVLISFGNAVGNSFNYLQGKFIAGAFVKNEKYLKLIERMKGGGVKELVLIRLNPITSIDSVSYFAGALGMKYWKFLIATVVGVTPLIVVGTLVGTEVLQKYDNALNLLMAGVGLFVVWVVGKKVWETWKKT
jgi:uncharacterized membrane protein YdjX (TVP38/TMEM64 family)